MVGEKELVKNRFSMKLRILIIAIIILLILGLFLGFFGVKKISIFQDKKAVGWSEKSIEETCGVLNEPDKTKCTNEYWLRKAAKESDINYCNKIEDYYARESCKLSITG